MPAAYQCPPYFFFYLQLSLGKNREEKERLKKSTVLSKNKNGKLVITTNWLSVLMEKWYATLQIPFALDRSVMEIVTSEWGRWSVDGSVDWSSD